jgi:hypothetical protein
VVKRDCQLWREWYDGMSMYPMYLFSSHPTYSAKFIHDGNSDSEHNERIERLKFHLETGDYFPMLATVLGFIEETVSECECTQIVEKVPLETKAVRDARKDLLYLHRNYYIVPKEIGNV